MKKFCDVMKSLGNNFLSTKTRIEIKCYSKARPLCAKDGQGEENRDTMFPSGWQNKILARLAGIRTEWQRSEFFKEGGRHSEQHNIRPQQEYAIPRKYVVIILGFFIASFVISRYPIDLTENNAYFKMSKQKSKDNCKEIK